MTTLTEIHSYYKDRINEIKNYSNDGGPWSFLIASAYIDFLVKLVQNTEQTSHKHYKDFIRDYLSLINPQYKDFKYENGLQDLPEQMYHVLRCGIVHSFSLVPDQKSVNNGGRSRSILLAHKKNNAIHFHKHKLDGFDSVVFTAEDFVEDLSKVLDKIFLELAPTNTNLQNNILARANAYPPIGALITQIQ